MFAILFSLAPVEPPFEPQTAGSESEGQPVSIIEGDAHAMLALALTALDRQQVAIAVQIYEALIADHDPRIRNEARYQLALLAMETGDLDRSIGLLRAVLAEDPTAQPVRLQLALVLARNGDNPGARAMLRQAGKRPLPDIIARQVERLYTRLEEDRTSGIDVSVFLARDSNVNRATRSDTIGTVIGDFVIDEDSRPVSETGIGVNSEAFVRKPLGQHSSMVLSGAMLGELYREARFNDIAASVSSGIEFPLSGGRGRAMAGLHRRWLGGERLLDSVEVTFDWHRPLMPGARFSGNLGYSRQDFEFNDLQDAHSFSLSGRIDMMLDSRSGVSVELGGARQIAEDPAYSFVHANVSVTAGREWGPFSLFGSASYQRLEADARLALLAEKRKEDLVRLSIGAGHRALRWRGWTPRVHVIWERNDSPVELYDYERLRGEVRFVRGF